MTSYSIGIDYGTQSARGELVRLSDGAVVASVQGGYAHGVMEHELPGGTRLGASFALQDGRDYWDLVATLVHRLMDGSGVAPEAVIGMGLDTTSCTILALDADMEPLSARPQFADEPLAHVLLWKHHAAQRYAAQLNRIAVERGEGFMGRYGSRISSEWMFPKIMQVAAEAPHVYAATQAFSEVGDWLCFKLTGTFLKSNVMAGYKSLWTSDDGYPSREFFAQLNPLMADVVTEKLSQPVGTVGQRVGYLTRDAAALLGLTSATAVSVAHSDACVVPAALGLGRVGQMVMSIGTSTCHLLLGAGHSEMPGMCGAVVDGTLPGFTSYELGQAAVGDIFGWFVDGFASPSLADAAENNGIDVYELLGQQAARLAVGESGLIALDWWNGNRSVLVDADLTGLILGLTLKTTPAEIYRALIEATAFGTRRIIDTLTTSGVSVTELYAAGGIPRKSPLLSQIYADVCGLEIHVPRMEQSAAYGSALFGAVAAGAQAGGFDTVAAAAEALGCRDFDTYRPRVHNSEVYDSLYSIYNELHDLFGAEGSPMKQLLTIRGNAASPAVL